ncbi:MAG: MFS transporter [Bacteroidetes bacterium]|nr:MFS transporter [Bacteroidota bacterium]
MNNIKINDKKTIHAWTFYDWANSVFPLVITSAIFPNYYDAVTSTKNQSGEVVSNIVSFFGLNFENQNIYSFIYAFALLIVVFIAPILSGIADYLGNKKRFLQFFCYLGAVSCMSLFFFSKNHLELSFVPFITATIGYWGSLVYYNSYLPEIATPDKQDKVSAKGFAMGYFGSSLLLIVCLALVMSKTIFHLLGDNPEYKGIDVRVSFLLVGLWWIGFAQYTFKHLPDVIHQKPKDASNKLIKKGFYELLSVFKIATKIKKLKQFLLSYFFYNMGVQTVMVVAVLFARKEIDWGTGELAEKHKTTALIVSILIIQFVGIAGSFIISKISSKIGNIKALLITVFIWIFICTFTYAVVKTPSQFYIVAFLVGFVMGGIQSLSRSTYSKYLPASEDNASFFSFYDVIEKLGMVMGTVLFSLISEVVGGMRQSILSLIIFFIIGFITLARLSILEKKTKIEDRT